jgi:hypothetical protein
MTDGTDKSEKTILTADDIAAEHADAALGGTRPAQSRRGSAADHDALLARYGLGELPAVFAIQGPDGKIIQEKAACYQCATEGFYGRGMTGTFYQEGDILVAEFTPNEWMTPLNRAAAIKVALWRETLPANQAPISIEDMSEAAQMLAKDPRVVDLPPIEFQRAVTSLASRLKIKRQGKDAMELVPMAHNFNPAPGGKAPPILGAKLSDMGQRGPGFTNTAPAGATTQGGARRATVAPSPLGGPTGPR